MSGDASLLVGDPLWLTAQWTGRDSPCDFLLTRGPCFVPTEGIVLHMKLMRNFPLHVLFVSLFPSVGSRCRGGISENRAVETWNSFNVSSFCFYFEGLWLWFKVFLAGRQPEKPHQLSTKKRKNPKMYFFLLFLFVSTFSFCLFLFFRTCLRRQRGRSSSCWTSEGSSGPSRSSRRCSASSGAAVWEEGSGSIYRSGWSDRSC